MIRPARKRAILLAAKCFEVNPDTGAPYQNEILECEEMLQNYEDILIYNLGFTKENIITLKDTDFDILKIIATLLEEAYLSIEGDEFFIYINTHGVTDTKKVFYLFTHRLTQLMPLNMLVFLLKGFKKDTKINLITDVCFSGSILNLDTSYQPVAKNNLNKIINLFDPSEVEFIAWLKELIDNYEKSPFSASIIHIASVDQYTEAHSRLFNRVFSKSFQSITGSKSYHQLLKDISFEYDMIEWPAQFSTMVQFLKTEIALQMNLNDNNLVKLELQLKNKNFDIFQNELPRKRFEEAMLKNCNKDVSSINLYRQNLIKLLQDETLFSSSQSKLNVIKVIGEFINFYQIKILDMPVLNVYGPLKMEEIINSNF